MKWKIKSSFPVIVPVLRHFEQATNKYCKHVTDLQSNLTLNHWQHTVCGTWNFIGYVFF